MNLNLLFRKLKKFLKKKAKLPLNLMLNQLRMKRLIILRTQKDSILMLRSIMQIPIRKILKNSLIMIKEKAIKD